MQTQISCVTANGLDFRCRVAGGGTETVILLHGFPETSAMWTDLLPALAEAGYSCLAPDQRGYSPGARPTELEAYAPSLLVSDVVALARARGIERFHLVGHDWGSAIGWLTVREHPNLVASWTALSMPHLASYGRAFRHDPVQRERSQYIHRLMLPAQPEKSLAADNFAGLRSLWRHASESQVAEYLEVFSAPGALTAAINWYRTAFAPERQDWFFQPFFVSTPSLVIWGRNDPAVDRSTTRSEKDYMRGLYRFIEMDATHWPIQEQFNQCAHEILAHLRAHPIASPSSVASA